MMSKRHQRLCVEPLQTVFLKFVICIRKSQEQIKVPMNIAMKKRLLTLVLLLSACSLCPTLQAKGDYPYRNAKLPTAERVADLLNRMTLEEKIGQLRCLLAWDYYTLQQNKVYPSDTFKTLQKATSAYFGLRSALIPGQKRVCPTVLPPIWQHKQPTLCRNMLSNTRA